MRNTKERGHAELGVHIGSASIVMIFAVLCLTIFAALAFETASYEQRLAEKSASAAQRYYAADGIAEERYLQICTLLQSEMEREELYAALSAIQVTVQEQDKRVQLYYTVPIDDTQELIVALLWQPNDVLRTMQWRVAAVAQWSYDDKLQVWDGD